MSNIRTLKNVCKPLNVRIYDDGDSIGLLAPKGFIFSSSDTHELSCWYKSFSRSEACSQLLDDAKSGVVACIDPECEWCQESGLPYGLAEESMLL